jgi:class 3 adenylate cyclase
MRLPNLDGAALCLQCAESLATAVAELRRGKTPAACRHGHASPWRYYAGRAARQASREGERRHLTVMFGDLVDSTAVSAQLDPKTSSRDRFLPRRTGMIERFDGPRALSRHGILAYFTPARTKTTRRVPPRRPRCHAALTRARVKREHGVRLASTGIHTGRVVLAMARGDRAVRDLRRDAKRRRQPGEPGAPDQLR